MQKSSKEEIKTYYPDGKPKSEKSYENGELHGLFKTWYESGKPQLEANYENGKLHGPFKTWYENEKPEFEVNHENGKLHGLFKAWYENGKPKSEKSYENGNNVESAFYNINGELTRHRYTYNEKTFELDIVNATKENHEKYFLEFISRMKLEKRTCCSGKFGENIDKYPPKGGNFSLKYFNNEVYNNSVY